jgi:hypothetical protein
MVEILKFGTSINKVLPSELSTTTNHGTTRTLVRQRKCKSGALTQDGGKSLFTVVNTSVTFKNQIDALMFTKEKMLKVKTYKFILDIMVPTRDGRSSILTRKLRLRLRD